MPTPPVVAVVNSSKETVDALRTILEDEGFNTAAMHVDDVRSGSKDFVSFVDDHKVALVIWDIAPPYDHNWAFLRLVRKAFADLPFVVTTTNKRALEELVGKTETLELVGKPYDLEQILDAVKRALKGYRLPSARTESPSTR